MFLPLMHTLGACVCVRACMYVTYSTCSKSISCVITRKSGACACATMSTKPGADTVNLAGMRIKYKDKSEVFTEDYLVSKEPITQFKAWFEEACNNSQILEPNAVLIGTATRDGVPSVRAVLLKSFGTEGFTFYTNYNSRKGREIAENPHVALTFYWEPLRRSVRIEGIAEKTSTENSDYYFQSRPYESQISAAASKQSSVVASRDSLIAEKNKLLAQFPEGQTKRPDC
ncbi:pyridoxine-5'-phosphate oxidase-like isoform X2 [Odontomachus brunneus]|nr:pyridoxine-5'-phosphate oxidase-like isoform X2 [Odontomachus brunneus]